MIVTRIKILHLILAVLIYSFQTLKFFESEKEREWEREIGKERERVCLSEHQPLSLSPFLIVIPPPSKRELLLL